MVQIFNSLNPYTLYSYNIIQESYKHKMISIKFVDLTIKPKTHYNDN